jgi:hypothetical protein
MKDLIIAILIIAVLVFFIYKRKIKTCRKCYKKIEKNDDFIVYYDFFDGKCYQCKSCLNKK